MLRSDDRPRLLVSVRDMAEAQAALAGGCDVLDIKEPARGSLGRAGDATVEAIVDQCRHTRGDAVPISAAMGELCETENDAAAARRPADDERLSYLKLGLAGAPPDWRARLAAWAAPVGHDRFVAVAYADATRAGAPPVTAVLRWAMSHGVAGCLIDTCVKDGRGLFDWLGRDELRRVIGAAREAGLFVALAGSLAACELDQAVGLGPDVIAVRGAACAGRSRTGAIGASRVAGLKRGLVERSAVARV